MGILFRGTLLALVLAILPAPGVAQGASRAQQVTFTDGRATVKGAIRGYATADYVFPAGAGESIVIDMKTQSPGAYFNVNPPGSGEAIFIGAASGTAYSGVAPIAGDYTVRVYMTRNAARRGRAAAYTLTIDVGRKSATNGDGPDFADGLAGGPDYREVAGVGGNDALKRRAAAAPKGKPAASAANGAALKNLGCKNAQGRRWRHVSDGAGASGWADGRYRREGRDRSHYAR